MSFFSFCNLSLYVFSFYLALASAQFFSFWVALELNLVLFIVLMNLSESNHLSANMKYFIVQSMGSGFFLSSIFCLSLFSVNLFMYMMILSMLLKMGAVPFHNWVLILSEKLSWNNFFLLSTLQKLMPLYLLNQVNLSLSGFIIFLNISLSLVFAWDEYYFKKLLALSSIFMIGWLLSSNFTLSFIYLFIYSAGFYLLKSYFFSERLESFSHNSMKSTSNYSLTLLSLVLLNFAGLPPFSLFFCKILILKEIMSGSFFLAFFLLMSSAGFVWVYTRLMVNLFSFSSSLGNWSAWGSFNLLSLSFFLTLGMIPFLILYVSKCISFWT